MFRPRIIPCLLLKNLGLVKTIKFKKPTYIGDPMNAIRIYNKKKADELIFLDIQATNENRSLNIDLIKKIGEECMMPFAVGGGLKSMNDIESIFASGAEKIVINSAATLDTSIIEQAAAHFGRQSIIVGIDIKRKFWGGYGIFSNSGEKYVKRNLIEYIKEVEEKGAGELFINSIDRDGTYIGYDIDLIKSISNVVSVPVIACGGAGKMSDFKSAVIDGNASAVSAGSMFVFHGEKRAVLINYPNKQEKIDLFN